MSIFGRKHKHEHEWSAWNDVAAERVSAFETRYFQERRCVLPKCRLAQRKYMKPKRPS